MKGTRTYQIALMVSILFGSSLIHLVDIGISMDDITDITDDTTELMEVVGKFYLGYLVFWKIISPHKMKHEE